MIEYSAQIAILFYFIAIIVWFIIWRLSTLFKSTKHNKLLYFPLLLTPIICIIEIISLYMNPYVETFKAEEQLITVIERNNSQLLTAAFGILVLATVFLNMKLIKSISKEFIKFLSFALICSIGGVLVLYWLPTNDPIYYFLLRHFKTIPYTYSIGFFLGGLLILVHEIPSTIKKEK